MTDPVARIVSQIIAATVNVAVTATAAHSLSLRDFGLFAQGWGVVQAAIFYVRVVLVPLVILDDGRPRLWSIVLIAWTAAIPPAVLIAVAGVALTGDWSVSCLLAAGAVAILTFEAARGGVIGYLVPARRPLAVSVDALYAVVALSVGLGLSLVAPAWRPVTCLLVSLPLASTASVLLALRLASHGDGTHDSLVGWAKRSRDGLVYGVAEWAAFALSGQIALVVLAVVASPVLVAGIRGGQALLFPFLLLGSTIPTILAPMLADARGNGVARHLWMAPLSVFGLAAAVWVALVEGNPFGWVRLLLDDVSSGAVRSFPFLVVGALFGIGASAVSVVLRSRGLTRRIAIARWYSVVLEVLLVVLGGLFGLTGAALGIALGSGLGLAILLLMLRTAPASLLARGAAGGTALEEAGRR